MTEYFVIYGSGGTIYAARVTATSSEDAVQMARVEGRVYVVEVSSTQAFTARRTLQVESD